MTGYLGGHDSWNYIADLNSTLHLLPNKLDKRGELDTAFISTSILFAFLKVRLCLNWVKYVLKTFKFYFSWKLLSVTTVTKYNYLLH